jgi:hypothetical protein
MIGAEVSAHAKTADEPRVVIKGQSTAKNDDLSGLFANQRIARGTEQVRVDNVPGAG